MRAALLLSAVLIASPAYAQSNSQYQGGDADAVTVVHADAAGDAGATAVASGNVVTVEAEDANAALSNDQHMDGDTSAAADAVIWTASGNVAITSAAVANGGTASVSNSDVAITSAQMSHGDASATTRFTGASAANAGTSASASGNVGAVSAQNSEVRLLSEQESTGSISASVEADHCCVSGQAVSGAIASANNLSVGGETATLLTDTRQNATGASVSARVDLYAGYATDASGNATANANAVTIDNQWGYVNSRVDQNATANVNADAYVTLGGDFLGFGSAGAYGVGNQAIVSNVGSDTVLEAWQSNAGDVSANAAMAGEGGGMALASSAAYGNSISASLCAYCDTNVPSLNASGTQTNEGDVRASAVINTPYAQSIGAAATAIGNAATYAVHGPGG